MNLTQVSSKSKLVIMAIVVVVFVSIAVLIFSFFQGDNQKQQNLPAPKTQSHAIALPIKPPESENQNVEQKKALLFSHKISQNNGDILILENENYSVKYITAPNVFFVTILTEPPQDYKDEVTQWFIAQGLNPNDLCLLNVRFRLGSSAMQNNNPNFSSLPDSCS